MGNIYADESLFRAGIRPRRRAASLTREQLRKLHAALQEVLREAIALGGSSVSDYVDADGEEGFFQLQHRVYGREGEPCLVCGNTIKRVVIADEAVITAVIVKSRWVQAVLLANELVVARRERSNTSIMGDYSIGVDLGGTNLRIAAVDSDGKLLEKLTLGAEVSRGRDFVITEMCKAIETLQARSITARASWLASASACPASSTWRLAW